MKTINEQIELPDELYHTLEHFYALMPDPTTTPASHRAWDKAWRDLLWYIYMYKLNLDMGFTAFHQAIGEHFFELNS